MYLAYSDRLEGGSRSEWPRTLRFLLGALLSQKEEDCFSLLGLSSISRYISAVMLVSPSFESRRIGIYMGATGA